MFKSRLTAVRPNEHSILNDENPNIYINGEITQYLLNHQLNGIRFLYRNYQKQSACILNDEGGSGKCFQCIAFFDAILKLSKSMRILIICKRKSSLEHWQFHIDCFLENISTNVADNEKDTQDSSTYTITIASLEYVLSNLSVFTTNKFDCVVFQDQHLETSAQSLIQLNGIKAAYKIVICSDDLMDNLVYFYELLKFCAQTGPLKQSKLHSQTLSLDEFKLKFGCKDDKSISKRNQAFRQRTLLNACSDFYLRRLCNQLGSQFPPISIEDFQKNFEAWKTINCDTVPLEAGLSQEDEFSPIELLPAPNDRTLETTNNDEISLLNTACTDFSDFDTQMSPLIYSDSDDSVHDDQDSAKHDKTHKSKNLDEDPNKIDAIPNASINSSMRFTPEIVCNQEHAAKARVTTKEPIPSTSNSHTTPIKRNQRISHDKISPHSKRLNYKQLPIEIKTKSNDRPTSKSRAHLFRAKKQAQNSTGINDINGQNMIEFTQNPRHRRHSSTSDIQIISQGAPNLSPILISTSSEDLSQPIDTTKSQNKTRLAPEASCPSPDLFNSFTSTKSAALSQDILNSSTGSDQTKTDPKTFRDVFGAPDECDDIDLLSNTNVDIFEITKNSVFDNVLCSAQNRITPLKGDKNAATDDKSRPIVNCLSGLRVVLPLLDNTQVEQIQNDIITQVHSSSQNSTDTIVDLTFNDTQKIIELSSEDSVRDVEKTPERKRELTPSTRSCLKRHSNETSITDEEKKRKSPFSRFGWMSSNRTSPKSETPQSRRRLDKWKHRTDPNNQRLEDMPTISRPRNLCKEYKSKSSVNMRRDQPSTSTAVSPTIFSDNE